MPRAILIPQTSIDPVALANLQDDIDGKANASHAHNSTDIADATATGRSVLRAEDAAAVLTAIGAAPDTILDGADPDIDTFAKVAAALANDPAFATTVATALAGKAATTQTPPIYVATSLPLPSRASVIPAGYAGVVGLITTLVPTITDPEILAFLTSDGDFVLELTP